MSVALCLEGGSREETESSIGLTHLLEHMLFKRTLSKSTFQLACEIDRLGGDLNASTDTDELVLYADVPGNRFGELISLLRELVLEPEFRQAELDLEKEVILQEISEANDDPDSAAFDLLSKIFWPSSSYGLPVFGTEGSVKSLSLEDLKVRLDQLRVGRRMLISVAGPVSLNVVKEAIEDGFEQLEEGDFFQREAIPVKTDSSRIARGVEQCHFALGIESASPIDEYFPASLIVSRLLGEGMSSRLFQEVRENRGLAYDISSQIENSLDTAMMLIRANSHPDKITEIVTIVSNQLADLWKRGPSESEIQLAKESLSAQFRMEEGVSSSLIWRMLESEQLYGRFVSASDFARRVEECTDQEIRNFLKDQSESPVLACVFAGAIESVDETEVEKLIEELK